VWGRCLLDDELLDFLFYLFIHSCDEPIKVANWEEEEKKKKKKTSSN
jgi:hypothetical protein